MHKLSLAGMNVGLGAAPSTSGESLFLRQLDERLGGSEVVVFDVGANRGDYARAVIEQFGERARIEAFEPSADAARELRGWACSCPHVHVHVLGLSSEEREALLV